MRGKAPPCFARRAALKPLLVGAADAALLSFCNNKSVPAAAISPDLDVWTYERKPAQEGVYQIKTQWAYFRHHDSDFLEMGLVKVAFLWELLVAGLNVLISDLDVVWLNGHWARWMAYGGAEPPLPEASLLAAADILVSTDFVGDKGRFDADACEGGLVVLDIKPTAAMLDEATAREVCAKVQKMRKDAKLRKEDKVEVSCGVAAGSVLERVMREQAEYVAARIGITLLPAASAAAARADARARARAPRRDLAC